MTAAEWCVGFPPQPPHVPTDRALIDVRHPGSFRLCRRCWLRWTAATDNRPEDTTDG